LQQPEVEGGASDAAAGEGQADEWRARKIRFATHVPASGGNVLEFGAAHLGEALAGRDPQPLPVF